MKNILNEQSTTIDLRQGRDTYKCNFLLGAQYVSNNTYPDGVMKRVATTPSKTPGNFEVDDILMIKSNYTYDVYSKDKKLLKSNLIWKCSTLDSQDKPAQLSAEQMRSVNDLIAKYPGMYSKQKPTADQLETGEWKKINLKKKFPDQFKFDYEIYEKGGLRQSKSPQQEKIIKTYLSRGWKDLGGKLNPAEADKYNTVDLKDDYPEDFRQSYLLVQPIESVDTNQLFQEMAAFVSTKDFGNRKTCRKGINTYYGLFNKSKSEQIPIDNATLKSWKLAITSCDSKIKNFNDLNITNNRLEKMRNDDTRFGLKKKESTSPTETESTPQLVQQENYSNLKKTIRESLLDIKETKRKNLIKESKIVNTRLSFITENSSFKTKKDRHKFCGEVLNEMIYLNSQGFDKKVIQEGFLEILGSFFGNTGESIQQTFKEYIAKWLVNNLTRFDTTGWVGGTIVRAIGNLPLGDIGRLTTDCGFTTKLVAKSIAEEAVEQLKQKAKLEGAIYDILRNSLVETMEDSSFGQKIESALGQIICPMITKVSGKMGDAAEQMKKGALAI